MFLCWWFKKLKYQLSLKNHKKLCSDIFYNVISIKCGFAMNFPPYWETSVNLTTVTILIAYNWNNDFASKLLLHVLFFYSIKKKTTRLSLFLFFKYFYSNFCRVSPVSTYSPKTLKVKRNMLIKPIFTEDGHIFISWGMGCLHNLR